MKDNKINFNKREKQVSIGIDPGVYPMEAIYTAAYNLLDYYYFFLSGNPEENILVKIEPKDKRLSLEKTAKKFLDELINTSIHLKISSRNKKLREYYIASSLLGVSSEIKNEIQGNNKEEQSKATDDPLGIATPWEEKNNNE